MSDRINCRNCIHFNDLEHRCCLNDGKAIKRECYFILSNRKPKGKDVVIENLKTKIADSQDQLALTKKAFKLAVFELDFYKNHSQSTSQECLERIERLETKIWNKAKEMMKSE